MPTPFPCLVDLSDVESAVVTAEPDITALVKSHQAEVWRFLRFLGCDVAEAEDLAQETFLAILGKPVTLRNSSAIASYLRTVARNLFLKSLRSRKSRPSAHPPDLIESVWADFSREDGGLSYLEALRTCLAELGERGLSAVQKRYRDGESLETIARTLNMSREGTKTLLRRVKERLKKCVDGKLSHE